MSFHNAVRLLCNRLFSEALAWSVSCEVMTTSTPTRLCCPPLHQHRAEIHPLQGEFPLPGTVWESLLCWEGCPSMASLFMFRRKYPWPLVLYSRTRCTGGLVPGHFIHQELSCKGGGGVVFPTDEASRNSSKHLL